MNYISTKEAAEKWGIGMRRVQYFCANEMVPGARLMGRQWVVPADAKRPVDGRTHRGKTQKSESYHFPVFIYSPCYADPSDLDANEQKLLEAQILRLKGKYVESIEICRGILSEPISPYLAAGVYLTIGFDAMLLGIISEYQHALDKLDKLLEEETQHNEDMRLIRAFLLSNSTLNCSETFTIDPEKLSAEAAVYHKYCLLTSCVPSGEADGIIAFRYFLTDLPQMERAGITPAVYSYHCLLGSISSPANNLRERELHMQAAVDLAVKNGWVANLSRYYNISSGLIDKCLASHGNKYIKELEKAYRDSMRGWYALHAIKTGSNDLMRYSSEQIELLLLVSYRYSNSTIATVKDITCSEVERALAEICAIAGVSTKAELVEYSRKILIAD